MSTIYELPLTLSSQESTYESYEISVGGGTILIQLQWAVASEEQYNIVARYLKTKSDSDPLNNNGEYSYDYDYLEYYYALKDYTEEELTEWIQTASPIPNSLIGKPPASQLKLLQLRIEECETLYPVVQLYKELLRWQFKATYNDDVIVGLVEPGGWYLNQDAALSFRFVSDLTAIRQSDLDKVTMEFEIKE